MTPSSCSHPSRNLFPRAATPRAECFSILDQRSRARRIVLGRIEADDDQILRADQPSLHKSLCSRRLSSPRFSPFIIARPATTSGLRRNEDRKSLAWTEGEGCVIEETKRKDFLSPLPHGKDTLLGWTEERAKLCVVENIIEALIEPRDEIDARVSYLSGRLNISTGRNFRWMKINFVQWEDGRECFDRIVSSIIDNLQNVEVISSPPND